MCSFFNQSIILYSSPIIMQGKTTKIIGFNWTSVNEIVFITDHGLELYQVIPEKKTLKSVKSSSLNINWFVFMVRMSMLLYYPLRGTKSCLYFVSSQDASFMRQSRCSFLNAWDNTQVARTMTSVFIRNTRWRHGRSRGEKKYRWDGARGVKVQGSIPVREHDIKYFHFPPFLPLPLFI